MLVATRPYQSEPATPETLQPLGSSRNVLEEAPPKPQPRPAADISRTEAGDAGKEHGDFSLAMQAATLATTTAIANSGQSVPANNNQNPPPSSPEAGGPSPTSPFTPVMPVQPATELPPRANSTQTNPAAMAIPPSADGSRLLPPPPGNVNWPVISICVVGLLGAIAACFLIYSIAHENPAPRVA